MDQLSWSIEKIGVPILVDEYGDKFPTGTLMSVDLETNGVEYGEPGFEIVCIGLSDGKCCWVYFSLLPRLIEYLKTIQIVAHNGHRAEVPWLTEYGITIGQLAYDTQILAYTFDSTRKSYGLKKLLSDILGVAYPTYSEIIKCPSFIKAACEADPTLYITKIKKSKKTPTVETKLPKEVTLDKMPQEIVAQYNACDTYWTWQLFDYYRQQYNAAQWNFFNTIEMPTARLIYEMEKLGIQIDTKSVRRIHNENSRKRRLAKRLFFGRAGRHINLNSPKQVLSVLHDFNIKAKGTGADVLAPFVSCHPIVQNLFAYREPDKICTTYTRPLYFNAIKTEDNRIHARFNQNTVTGRLSSSDPINLQNQPQEVRECFVAMPGHLFVNADFSNIELRLPAHFSGDPGFVAELSKPMGDLHTLTANQLFGGDIRSLPDKERKEKRKAAKEALLTIANSGTEYSLSSTLDCSIKEALQFKQHTERLYPVFVKWLAEEKKMVRAAGGISTYFGRWVALPQIALWCGDLGCDKKRRRCDKCFMRREAEKTAISVRVQGTASDMIKLSALRLKNTYSMVPVLSVHDELVYEVQSPAADMVMDIVKEAMENVVEMKVPIVADVSYGANWALSKGK